MGRGARLGSWRSERQQGLLEGRAVVRLRRHRCDLRPGEGSPALAREELARRRGTHPREEREDARSAQELERRAREAQGDGPEVARRAEDAKGDEADARREEEARRGQEEGREEEGRASQGLARRLRSSVVPEARALRLVAIA